MKWPSVNTGKVHNVITRRLCTKAQEGTLIGRKPPIDMGAIANFRFKNILSENKVGGLLVIIKSCKIIYF